MRGTITESSPTVVARGATSLSSIAWLDRADGPQVPQVPEVAEVAGQEWMLALVDARTENVAMPSSAVARNPVPT